MLINEARENDKRQHERWARENASQGPASAPVSLAAYDSMASAQEALAAMLFGSQGESTVLHFHMVRYAYRWLRDMELAKDAAMQAYIRVAKAWSVTTDAQGMLMRQLRLQLLSIKRKRNDETTIDDIADYSDEQQIRPSDVGRSVRYQGIEDEVRDTLASLMDGANATEKRILRLTLANADDWTVGHGTVSLNPDMAMMARQMGLSESAVRKHMKALGVRLGLWRAKREQRGNGAGPRRSQWWFARQMAATVWTWDWYALGILPPPVVYASITMLDGRELAGAWLRRNHVTRLLGAASGTVSEFN